MYPDFLMNIMQFLTFPSLDSPQSEELMDNTAQRARVIRGIQGLPDIGVFMGTSCFRHIIETSTPPVISSIPSFPKSFENAKSTVQTTYT